MKIVAAILVLAIGIILQLTIGGAFGLWPSFALAALVAAVFFLGFWELLVLVLSAVFALNWQPAWSWELIALGGLPLVFFFARERFSWQAWLVNLFLVSFGVVLFYAIFGIRFVFAAPSVFLADLLGTAVFGTIVFWALAKTENLS